MLGRVDIVSVNCPHTPATNRLLTRELLSMMQPSAYLVNTSRGEVIDEVALADLLASRQIAGVGLDVYENEPDITAPLIGLPNVVLPPHIGSATIEGRLEMGDKVIINIQTFWDGHTPRDRVIEATVCSAANSAVCAPCSRNIMKPPFLPSNNRRWPVRLVPMLRISLTASSA